MIEVDRIVIFERCSSLKRKYMHFNYFSFFRIRNSQFYSNSFHKDKCNLGATTSSIDSVNQESFRQTPFISLLRHIWPKIVSKHVAHSYATIVPGQNPYPGIRDRLKLRPGTNCMKTPRPPPISPCQHCFSCKKFCPNTLRKAFYLVLVLEFHLLITYSCLKFHICLSLLVETEQSYSLCCWPLF